MFDFIKHLNPYFEILISEYGFRKQNEINDGQSYSIEYNSDTFTIKVEKYRREFYVTVCKIGSDKEINLFNLLGYLKRNSKDVPKSEYFTNEKNIDESYRKQFVHISDTIYDNFKVISDFFITGNYEAKIAEIEKYMQDKYPELFKRT